jgi:HlyD family secretion protein
MKRIVTRIVWALVLFAIVGGGLFYWRYTEAHKPPPLQYVTVKVEKKRIIGKVTASGTLQATVTVQVGTQVSGRVQKLFADFNSPVKKGQLVAKIDPQLFQAASAQAHANYVSARAGLVKAEAQERDAEMQFSRTKALSDQNLASGADLQTATTNVAVAKAGVDVAKASIEQAAASLNQANVNLSYTNITSPIDGIVISRNVDVGQTVAASLSAPVIFTIAEDLRKMQVNTNIAEGDVGRLQPQMATYFTVDAFPGQRFKGIISTIRNAAQTLQNVVTYDAVIDVDNTDLKLRPGMTANVTIIYEQKDDVLAIPNAALRFKPPPEMSANAASAVASSVPSAAPASPAPSGSGRRRGGGGGNAGEGGATEARGVWLLRDGQAVSVSVKVGLSDGSFSELLDGDVKEGDLVITDATVSGKGATKPAAGAAGTRMPRL